MTNNEYQTMAMTHYMLREFRKQSKEREEATSAENNKIEYQQFQDDVLDYPIFSNHACGNHDAKELLTAGKQTDYRKRWSFFYTPAVQKLPQIDYQQKLDEELVLLKHRIHGLNSPRLILFAATFFSIILLVMRGHFLLPILPIFALVVYWRVSEMKLQQAYSDLRQHLGQMHNLDIQQEDIASQLDSLPPPTGLEQLNQSYQRAIEDLLRNTLEQVLNTDEIGNLGSTLKNQRWDGFLTESWSYLQVPLPAQENSGINHTLLNADNITLTAMQDDPLGRKGHSLFRMQYLHIWILTRKGLLMGSGHFDRVANQFLYEQHEFYPYPQLSHIHLADQPLPEMELLQARLPEAIYQRYFQQPVSVLSMGTSSGKMYQCATLPVSERPFRQTEWKERYDLDTDMQHLNRSLHQRLYGSAQTA